MLIDKQIGVGDIISLKLISGEELIGKIKNINSSEFTINKPLILNVVAIPAQDGSMQHALQLSPFMFGLDEANDIKIPMTGFIAYTKTRNEMKQSYLQETSSIEVPKGPTLVV